MTSRGRSFPRFPTRVRRESSKMRAAAAASTAIQALIFM